MIRIFHRDILRRALAAGASALLLAGCGGDDDATGPGSRRGRDDFSSNTISRYAVSSDDGTSWTVRDGKVVGDGYAIHSVLIRRDAELLEDGWVETATSQADDGGLVLGYRDNANYYLLTVRDDAAPFPRGDRNLAVYHRFNGTFYELWNTNVAWPRGSTRTIRFELVGGDHLRVLMDGTLMAEGPVDPTGGGGFGLRHYGADDSWASSFDLLRWEIKDED